MRQLVTLLCIRPRPITSGPDLCHSAIYSKYLYYTFPFIWKWSPLFVKACHRLAGENLGWGAGALLRQSGVLHGPGGSVVSTNPGFRVTLPGVKNHLSCSSGQVKFQAGQANIFTQCLAGKQIIQCKLIWQYISVFRYFATGQVKIWNNLPGGQAKILRFF